jgi:hypothetical protein
MTEITHHAPEKHIITHLVRIEAKRINQFMQFLREPVGAWPNTSVALYRRSPRTIKNKHRDHTRVQ